MKMEYYKPVVKTEAESAERVGDARNNSKEMNKN